MIPFFLSNPNDELVKQYFGQGKQVSEALCLLRQSSLKWLDNLTSSQLTDLSVMYKGKVKEFNMNQLAKKPRKKLIQRLLDYFDLQPEEQEKFAPNHCRQKKWDDLKYNVQELKKAGRIVKLTYGISHKNFLSA